MEAKVFVVTHDDLTYDNSKDRYSISGPALFKLMMTINLTQKDVMPIVRQVVQKKLQRAAVEGD